MKPGSLQAGSLQAGSLQPGSLQPGPLPSPVRGDLVAGYSVDVDRELQTRAKDVAQLRSVDVKALEELADRYVRDVLAGNEYFNGQHASPVTMLKIDLRQGHQVEHEDEQLAATLKRRVAGAGMELAKIWGDGIVHESELGALRKVVTSLDTILEMKADRKLGMIGRDARPKVDAAFHELSLLAAAAHTQLDKLDGSVKERDLGALKERLADPTPIYRTADLATLAQLNGVERYSPGDLLVTSEYQGVPKFGVVVAEDQGKLRVEVLDQGNLKTISMTAQDVADHNALKIGDHFDLDGRQIWIRPSLTRGVVAEEREGLQIQHIEVHAFAGELEARRVAARGNIAGAGAGAGAGAVDVGAAGKVDAARIFVAGGKLTAGVENIASTIAKVSVLSELGAKSNFNDDAVVSATLHRPDGRELLVIGVADQANGAHGEPGFASSQAAGALLAAGEKHAREGVHAKAALNEAVNVADDVCTGKGLTTLTGAILEKSGTGLDATVVNVGDSIAWHFSSRGRLHHATTEHNIGRGMATETGDPNANPGRSTMLTRAIGHNAKDRAELLELHMVPGDFLVFVTHGGSQANLTAQKRANEGEGGEGSGKFTAFHSDVTAMHIGSILAEATSAEDATRAVREYIHAQMANGDGRDSNNVTVAVVQA